MFTWLVENRAKTYCRGRFFGNIDTTIPANQVNPSEGVRTTKARSNFLNKRKVKRRNQRD